jgi:hypothetical protein
MTPDQLDAALPGFCRRKRFHPFILEFNSGQQLLIPHPEAIGPKGELYLMRFPDGGYVAFTAEDVTRLFDNPVTPTT